MSEKKVYRPLSNKITVKVLPRDEKVGQIIKPPSANDPLFGIVQEVGRGVPIVVDEGKWSIVPLELEKGMKVMFPPNVGQEIEVEDGENLLLITEDMVLTIVE